MENITTIRNLLTKQFLEDTEEEELYALLQGMTELSILGPTPMHSFKFYRLGQALMKKESTITKLRIYAIDIDRFGFANIMEALMSPDCKVTELEINMVGLDDERAGDIAAALLDPHCKLTQLDLSSNLIGDDGAIAIADALKSPNCRLILLDISDNDFIGETGKNAIANALKVNMTLTTLRPSFLNTSEEVSLNRKIKDLYEKFFVYKKPFIRSFYEYLAQKKKLNWYKTRMF